MASKIDIHKLRPKGTRIGDVIAAAPLPPNVAQALLVNPDARADILRNRHLDAATLRQAYRPGLSATEAATIVAFATDPAMVEIFLHAGDTRDGPLRALVAHWNLSVEDQLALCQLDLTANQVTDLVNDRELRFSAPAKISLLARSNWAIATRWLAIHGTAAPDDAVWAHLAARSTGKISGQEVVQEWELPGLIATILGDHPGLIPQAIHADHPDIVASAVMRGLTPALQHEAVEAIAPQLADQRWVTHRWVTALANLCDHPSTVAEVRTRGWQLALEHHFEDAFAERGVPSPASPSAPGVPLAEVDDPIVIELLCLRDSSGGYSSGRQLQWLELVDNPHLSRLDVRRLLAHIADHSVTRRVSLAEWDRIEAACKRVGLHLPSRLADVKRNLTREAANAVSAEESNVAVHTGPKSAPKVGDVQAANPATSATADREWVWERGLANLAAWFVEALGPHPGRWELAVSLAASFDGSFAELAETAVSLHPAA